jgi:thiamine biosynthesis lipoprotein
MGTTFTVVAYDEDRRKLESSVDQAFEEVRRLDALLSNYRKDSEWSRVNRDAADKPVPVSGELFRLLAACVEYGRKSEGAFDITVGPLIKLWGFYKGSGRLPHRAEIRSVLARTGYKNVLLDPDSQTVRFRKQGVEIDPGGIGKGYAVDSMVDVLKTTGVVSALISAGGSSIYALGSPPGQQGWKVKIRHPRSPSKTVEEILLTDGSMSTSGSYEKFFVAGGKLYSHIFDPHTGYPATGMLSVSVVAPRTLDSEAWTKPFFVRGRSWAARNKPEGFRVYLCEDRMEVACAWLQ